VNTLLRNATLVDIDPLRVERADLRMESGRIASRGPDIEPAAGETVIECHGFVVLPGFVNGHTHLYSALAVGMPGPPEDPRNFREILEKVWWRLDQALDAESIEMSARVGAMVAARCGTTTLIDHHASPDLIAGSLDLVATGIRDVGLRAVLCYETTDRHGPQGCEAGLQENHRFIERCRNRNDGQFAALLGAHASFTLEDDSLRKIGELADSLAVGVHIHVAEDPCDEEDAMRRGHASLMGRLDSCGLLRSDSIFAHCTHLDPEAVSRINAAGLTVAHNPRSNMNNAVGYAPVADFAGPPLLGTDGIGGDMLAELQTAWMISRHQGTGLSPQACIAMLAGAARCASEALGVTVGKLEVGAAADVILTDLVPATPLDGENVAGHLVFGMDSRHVRDVMVNGEWVVRDRQLVLVDTGVVRKQSLVAARKLWDRMGRT
jgi:putative selenium metabolism protein SsnA